MERILKGVTRYAKRTIYPAGRSEWYPGLSQDTIIIISGDGTECPMAQMTNGRTGAFHLDRIKDKEFELLPEDYNPTENKEVTNYQIY